MTKQPNQPQQSVPPMPAQEKPQPVIFTDYASI
ncbi:hypothetical protein LCGC14_0138120 [marine sediment metagenome]|jgi:hypothetical protein|uniref:Uncharacterized protein n=1 Tax=marine sediment metagenome TaxID=412755 RepID=A0A0F9Y3V9_9ZZZZ